MLKPHCQQSLVKTYVYKRVKGDIKRQEIRKIELIESNVVPETVRLGLAGLWDLLGVDEVPGAPVALHEPPRPSHVHRVPGVSNYQR